MDVLHIIAGVFGVGIVAGLMFLAPFLKAKLGEQRYALYKEAALDAIKTVKQVATGEMTNEEKKALAMENAKNFLAIKGVKNPDEEALDGIVEAALWGIKFAERFFQSKDQVEDVKNSSTNS